MPHSSMIGKRGRVTGTVRPGHVGEVTLPLEQGTNAFLAHPYDGVSTYPIGTRVIVVEYRTQAVYVEEDVQDPVHPGS
jgi:hypothetical protein